MKIAIGSDMHSHTTDVVVDYLKKLGHEVHEYGAITGPPAPWSKVAIEAATAVATGNADQAILFCWTGTGISIAANKIKGIRAALCTDAETARGARTWNDANVLAMSLRLVSEAVAKEIIDAWLQPIGERDAEDNACIQYLKDFDQ